MIEPGPPSAVPVPAALVPIVRTGLREVRMGVFLASVRLRDGTVVEPVVINARLDFIGLAVTAALDMTTIDFASEDVVAVTDASEWDQW